MRQPSWLESRAIRCHDMSIIVLDVGGTADIPEDRPHYDLPGLPVACATSAAHGRLPMGGLSITHTAGADLAAILAHELMDDACAGMPGDHREVAAESVAWAVCSRFGLDLSLHSGDVVAGWLDEPEVFRVSMAAIHYGAAVLIGAIEAAMTYAGELELAA